MAADTVAGMLRVEPGDDEAEYKPSRRPFHVPFRSIFLWRGEKTVYNELPKEAQIRTAQGGKKLALWAEGCLTKDLSEYEYYEPAANCVVASKILTYLDHLINSGHVVAVTFAPGNPFGIDFGTYTALVRVDAAAELVFFREYHRERPVQYHALDEVGVTHMAQQTTRKESKKSVTFAEFQSHVYDIIYCDQPVPLILKKAQPRTWIEKSLYKTAKGLLHGGEKTVFEVFQLLCREEFRQSGQGIDQLRFYTIVNRFCPKLSEKELETIWSCCDVDRDNFLNYVEFFKIFDACAHFEADHA